MKQIILFGLYFILISCSSTGTKPDKPSPFEERLAAVYEYMTIFMNQKREETLAKFDGNILSPYDVEYINWRELPGFSFSYRIVHNLDYEFERTWRLAHIEDDTYIFNGYEKGKITSKKRIYVNGRESTTIKIKLRDEEFIVSDEKCDNLVEGECEYKIGTNDFKKVIKYVNGVWKTITYKNGIWKSEKQSIYDKRGISLYQSLESATSIGKNRISVSVITKILLEATDRR